MRFDHPALAAWCYCDLHSALVRLLLTGQPGAPLLGSLLGSHIPEGPENGTEKGQQGKGESCLEPSGMWRLQKLPQEAAVIQWEKPSYLAQEEPASPR